MVRLVVADYNELRVFGAAEPTQKVGWTDAGWRLLGGTGVVKAEAGGAIGRRAVHAVRAGASSKLGEAVGPTGTPRPVVFSSPTLRALGHLRSSRARREMS